MRRLPTFLKDLLKYVQEEEMQQYNAALLDPTHQFNLDWEKISDP